MPNFGQNQEATDGAVKKLYTGVENFRVVAVNPTHEELKAIYGDNAKEPTYVTTNDDGDTQVLLNFFLDNIAEEGEDSIKTNLSFYVVKTNRVSSKGTVEVINDYGTSAWMNPDMTVPANMSWYNTEGMRKAYKGEPALIEMLKNLLNLPSLKAATEAGNPANAKASLSDSDWNTIFNGNFSVFQSLIKSTENKIGVLLGVKTVDDGKMYQATYNRKTLRQYTKATRKFEYLRKDVQSAQANGAFATTDFGDPSYVLTEFLGESTVTKSAEVSAPQAQTFSGFSAETANAFAGTN